MTLAQSSLNLDRQATLWDEALDPLTITIGSLSYSASGTVGPIRPEMDEKTMTYRQVQRASVEVRRAMLVECPAGSTLVTMSGLKWKIEELGQQQPGALVWRLSLRRDVSMSP
jgi:hypothetical protein